MNLALGEYLRVLSTLDFSPLTVDWSFDGVLTDQKLGHLIVPTVTLVRFIEGTKIFFLTGFVE